MKIVSVHAYLLSLPLLKPYTIAYKTITDTEIVFLEIGLENGITGMGSANPFAEVVGESPATTLVNLQGEFVQQLVGKDIRKFEKLIDDTILQFPNFPGTQAAIDIALHDAFGLFLQKPVVDIYGQKIARLPTSLTIGIKEAGEMLEEAKAGYAAGFRILKIKTGIDVEEDIARVTKIVEHFKNDIRIRVDANQGYSTEQLLRFCRDTAGLGIELIEQPLPTGKEKQLTSLDPEIRKQLVADESLLDVSTATALVEQPQPFGVFNIKLMKCGGITGARKIASVAEQAGISLFWGCNDESLVSISAALHAAFSCSNTKYLDLDGSFDIAETIVEGGFILQEGQLSTNGLPGLGIRKR